MEKIELAQMLPGAIPCSVESRNRLFKAHIQTNSDVKIAYVKLVPPKQLFIECVCAIIGRKLGLPIPRPFIVLITKNSLDFLNDGVQILAFGSEDVQHPSIFRRFSNDNSEAMNVLAKYPYLFDMSVFDEWIANGDRHLDNILFGGNNNLFFIDHELAFPEELNSYAPAYDNQLMRLFYENACELDKYRLKKQLARIVTEKYSVTPFSEISEKTSAACFLDDTDVTTITNFISERVEYLQALFDERVKLKQKELF